MLRLALVFGALALSPAAFACPDGDCSGDCAHHTSTSTSTDNVDAAAGTKATFTVAGMHCSSCVDKVVGALKGTEGVNAAVVDLDTGVAKVAFDPAKTNLDALITVVNGLGHFEAKKNDAS